MQNKKLHININSINFSTFQPKLSVQNYLTSDNYFQTKNKQSNERPNNSSIKNLFSNSNKLSREKYLKFYSPYQKLILTNRKKETKKNNYKNLILTLSPKANNQLRSLSTIKKVNENNNNNKEKKYQQIIFEKDETIKKLLKTIEYYKKFIDYIKINYNINLNEYTSENNTIDNLKTIEYNNDLVESKYNIIDNKDFLKNNRCSNFFRIKHKEKAGEKSNDLFNNSHLNLSLDKNDKSKKTIINSNINIFNSIEINKKLSKKTGHFFVRDSNKNPIRFLLLSNSNSKNNKVLKSQESNNENNKYSSTFNLTTSGNNETKKDERSGNSLSRDYKRECENIKKRTNNLILNLFSLIEKKCINK